MMKMKKVPTRTQSLWCAKPNGWEFDGNTMYIAHKTRYSALDNRKD